MAITQAMCTSFKKKNYLKVSTILLTGRTLSNWRFLQVPLPWAQQLPITAPVMRHRELIIRLAEQI